MIEKVKTYFERLERLSTEELDHSVKKLVRAEKRNVALVIAHIAEMSRRKGHLERGYKNLFGYCTQRLHLSEGSVALRIQVANVSRRFPQILVALAENRMSLTVAGLLAPVLTESNVEKLLSDCAGMTKRDAEEYLVALRPKPVFAPSIRKTPSRQQEQTSSPHTALAVPEAKSSGSAPQVSPSILEPARPEIYNFRFAADRKFKEKFERLAEVLGVENPLQHMAEIMEQALDVALDKKDLQRKRARRLEREAKRNGGTPSKKLVRARFSREKKWRKRSPATSLQRFASASTSGQPINANSDLRTGPGVAREPDSRLSTSGRLPSFAVTMSDSFASYAPPIIDWRPNMSTGRNSSSGRSMLLAG